jgi:hypothetical protein
MSVTGCGPPRQVWRGADWFVRDRRGVLRRGRQGMARRGAIRCGWAGQRVGGRGVARQVSFGGVWQGGVRQGMAALVCRGRAWLASTCLGQAGHAVAGTAWQGAGRSGSGRFGGVGRGRARHGGAGLVGVGLVRQDDAAWRGPAGRVGPGPARQGGASLGSAVMARLGPASRGRACGGKQRDGVVRLGPAGQPWYGTSGHVPVRQGEAWQAGTGLLCSGMPRRGMAGLAFIREAPGVRSSGGLCVHEPTDGSSVSDG